MATIRSNTKALLLSLISIANYGLTYVGAVVVARILGADGYDEFAVAVATVTILFTLGETGAGKYAIRMFPAYVERKAWGLARGFRRLNVVLILGFSIVLALATAILGAVEGDEYGDHALEVMVLFVPIMSLVGFGTDLLTANKAPYRAELITRILMPGTVLTLIVAWAAASADLDPMQAALCYVGGWNAGLIAVAACFRQTTPREVTRAVPEYEPREWVVRSLPFMFFALLIALLPRVGLLVLEAVGDKETEVALFAAAMTTGGFIHVIAKSTDKFFLPQISVMIEQGDAEGMRQAARRRLMMMGTICVLFLAAIFVFGRSLLSLFGPEFVSGYPALCIVSVATSVWTFFSLAPTYLKYIGRSRLVVVSTAITVGAIAALAFFLSPRNGATGTAVAYGIPVTLLYVMLRIVAFRHVGMMAVLQEKRAVLVSDEGRDDSIL